ncbi:NAD(P)-dependent glycerol-3-phosphate dehydrogenase [Candidatus Daviesbacteria bacterium]|nr:NAD(P)-dependent glycerol-3-phosphate dehydrogenase [Candidatus Daviesbacteria bacterium]
MERLKVAILPAGGAFGTAMSIPISANGHEVTLVFRDEDKAQMFGATRQIGRLPGVIFPESIGFISDTAEAVKDADLLVLATPARYLASYYLEQIQPNIGEDTIILCSTKGLVEVDGQYLRPSEVISHFDPKAAQRTAILSGPNFAKEIAQSLPFMTVIASQNPSLAEKMVDIFNLTSQIRIYPSDDLAGVEFGGAFKNTIAIAAGVSDGRQYGENARTGLISRGKAEIARLVQALGGRRETVTEGLVGADLWMSCTSNQSRNHKFGKKIGRGEDPQELLQSQTVEGYYTARIAFKLARRHRIETPIIDAVYEVLYNGVTVDEAIRQLQERKPVYEDGRPLIRSLVSSDF